MFASQAAVPRHRISVHANKAAGLALPAALGNMCKHRDNPILIELRAKKGRAFSL